VLSTKRGAIDAAFVEARLRAAKSLRLRTVDGLGSETDAYRLVHGEGDGLPGVVVDVYAGWAVVKFDGEAPERALGDLVQAALERAAPDLRGVLVRRGRGGDKTSTLARGTAPPSPVLVREHGMKLLADLDEGQKTGLFLDHRESRRRVRALAEGARVLNLYGYVGGFSIAAGLGGATHVTTVDVAAPAIRLAEAAWKENGLDPEKHVGLASDVPAYLESLRERKERFDVIVADPPSFAPSEDAVHQAMKSYRLLHRACLRLLAPGGLYLAASCSSHVGGDRFERTIREAAEKLGVSLQVLERWGAPADHPRLLAFPEGDYLKCVLGRVLV
jgi:23S rRNA (cytosine1962-C5)-methyltransferase